MAFNTLMDRVAADGKYLEATLAAAAEYDDFTVRRRTRIDHIGTDRRHTRVKT